MATQFPWYQSIKYQGADVSGSWLANIKVGEEKSTFSLVQYYWFFNIFIFIAKG